MRWIEEIVNAYEANGGIAHYSDIYKYIEENTNRKLADSWQDIIRREVFYHSSDSSVFRKKEDLFFSFGEFGNGVWGLRSHLSEETEIISEEISEPQRTQTIVNRIVRSTTNSKKIKFLYMNKCQICEESIELPNKPYSEAHHIHPLGKKHRGPDVVSNMMVVCPNHHVELDYGAIGFKPNSLELFHFDNNYPLNGKQLSTHPYHKIDKEYIKYHNAFIYKG